MAEPDFSVKIAVVGGAAALTHPPDLRMHVRHTGQRFRVEPATDAVAVLGERDRTALCLLQPKRGIRE